MERLSRPPFAWALVSVAICLVVALGALDGIPHVTDEVVYTLQARIFAAGARTAPAADVPSMLSYPFWVTGPKSHAAFPFGWPLLLAPFEGLGVGWLLNPLLMGVAVLLTHAVGRPLVGDRSATTAAMVVAVSPALVLLGASRMSHTSVLVALLLAAWPVVAGGQSLRWFAGGLGVAYAVLARPFDALLVGGLLLAVGATRLLRQRSGARLALFVVPAGLAAAWVLADNQLLQGHPFAFPADAFYDRWYPERPDCNRLGFGPDVGCVPVDGALGHTLSTALGHAVDRAVLLDRLMLGVPLMGLAALGAGLRRPVLLVPLGLVAVGHLFYWSPGLAYGPRFWALGVPGLALALATLPVHRLGRTLPVVVVALSAVGLAYVWPELSDRYWCVDGRLARYVDQLPHEEGLVLVEGRGVRPAGWPRLGVEDFTCDPMLEFGDALQVWDPIDGAWQPRHALSDPSQTELYRSRFQPGRPAWMVTHDVAQDERSMAQLP